MNDVPAAPLKATLVDVLDRVLEKGLIIDADIVITVAGIPLLGVKLRAALAGMDTMLKYGLMTQWDQGIRARGRTRRAPEQKEPLYA